MLLAFFSNLHKQLSDLIHALLIMMHLVWFAGEQIANSGYSEKL